MAECEEISMDQTTKKKGEQLLKRLEAILKIAQSTYYRGYDLCNYSGSKETQRFYREFVKEFYEPIFEQDKEMEFVDKKAFEKLKGKIFFDGDYVKIKEQKIRYTNFYFVYLRPFSSLKGCYEKALNEYSWIF